MHARITYASEHFMTNSVTHCACAAHFLMLFPILYVYDAHIHGP